jgi:hypothetical protein
MMLKMFLSLRAQRRNLHQAKAQCRPEDCRVALSRSSQ